MLWVKITQKNFINLRFNLVCFIILARYFARKFGLAGKDENESGVLDMYADQLTDLTNELAKILRESDPEKKKELQEKMAKEILPVHLKYHEERFAKSGSGYFAASGLTWVDLYLYVMLDWVPEKEKILEAFKNVKANREKIEANPRIAAWLKARPVTEM